MSSQTTLLSVTLPKSLLAELKKYVGPGKRSSVVARLLTQYLRYVKKREDESAYRQAYSDPEVIAESKRINQEFAQIDFDAIQLLDRYEEENSKG